MRTLVICLGLASGACSVGAVDGLADDDVQPDGPVVVDPRAATFDAELGSKATAKGCNGPAPCHSTQNPKMASFAQMTDTQTNSDKYLRKPATTNVIITKVAPGAQHQGVAYFDATEIGTISTWIESGP